MNESPRQFEIVVVGGGPAGIASACAAAENGKQVALLDAASGLGGQIWRAQAGKAPAPAVREWRMRLHRSRVKVFLQTSVVAAPRPGVLLAETPQDAWEIYWGKLILAPGARELFLPFPGWTLPGVMGAGGLQALVKGGWPVAGKRVALAGSGPLLLAVADSLKMAGAKIISLSEQAGRGAVLKFGAGLFAHPAKLFQGLQIKRRLLGVPQRCGVWPVQADGDESLRRVTFTDGRRVWTEECDLLGCGFGLVPNVELPLALGCELADGFVRVDDWQMTGVENVFCAGEPTGIGGVDCALVEGRIAGHAAAGARGAAARLFARRETWHKFRAALARAYALRLELKSLATEETLLCRCEDVALGRVKKFAGWRDAKLQTRCGMGVCQGRICGAAARVVLGWGMESVRPPVLPARVASFILTGNGPRGK